MIISDESVFLSLAIGVVLGFFWVVNKIILSGNKRNWIIIFIADFTFAVICAVLTFIAAIPIYNGRIRFYQLALELMGALAFNFTLGDAVVFVLEKIRGVFNKLHQFIRSRIIKKSSKKAKIQQKKAKK